MLKQIAAPPRWKVFNECARHRRGHGPGRAHPALARSFWRTFHEAGFHRGRDCLLPLDEISSAPFRGPVRGEGGGLESIRDWRWQSNGLARYRRAQEKKRRTVFGITRWGQGARERACDEIRLDQFESHRASRGGDDRNRSVNR